jgi:hypothetical protein
MRSHLRPQRHLRAKQARERISHAGSLHAAPQHTPGASLAVLNAPRRVGIDSRQDDVLTPWGWRASHSVDAAPVLIGALEVTCGAAANAQVSKPQAKMLQRPPLTWSIELLRVFR